MAFNSLWGFLVIDFGMARVAAGLRWCLRHVQMGNWALSRVPPSKPLPENVCESVFEAYRRATLLESDNYKAWHCWAMVRRCLLCPLLLMPT